MDDNRKNEHHLTYFLEPQDSQSFLAGDVSNLELLFKFDIT